MKNTHATLSDIRQQADFSVIRYGQCWEDADVLLAGLHVQPGDTCLSICSAGDNTLALLTANPAKVYAIDLSVAQLACLALRLAAYRCLNHTELLALIGSRPHPNRADLYKRCRIALDKPTQQFWDARPQSIASGIGHAGKFEHYFGHFRRMLIPWIQSQRNVDTLLKGASTLGEREDFYQTHWNHWRWRGFFHLFFSRRVMGRLGRDPSFFRYVEGSVADRILTRTQHALVQLNPAENPYLHWILTGTHGAALPLAMRAEHFDTIRERLDRVETIQAPLEQGLEELGPKQVDRFNLSDIFEYLSEANTEALLSRIANTCKPQGRLLYWNMLAPRSRPESLSRQLVPQQALSQELFLADKAFFYSRVVVEQRTQDA
ncbi:MAG: DUF3419 family protein [Candidatus Melainabacteria bacterium]|nr:DUF3419 family protein [Candidatus Melainabacteria bacterium]